jgi:hypothetical protein
VGAVIRLMGWTRVTGTPARSGISASFAYNDGPVTEEDTCSMGAATAWAPTKRI